MRRGAVVLILLVFSIGAAQAQQANTERVRKAVRLPAVSIKFGVAFQAAEDGPKKTKEERDAEITQVLRAMRGDASDAERYDRLADLYEESQDDNRANESAAKAVALYREQIKGRPDDVGVMRRLGEALDYIGKSEEAETTLRRALKADPKDWRCWLSLASVLESRVGALLREKRGDTVAHRHERRGDIMFFGETNAEVSEEAAIRAEKLLDEASGCYDKAVEVAPKEGESYRRRAVARVSWGLMRLGIRSARGEHVLPRVSRYLPESARDLRQAARLNPDDPCLIAMAIYWELMIAFESGDSPSQRGKKCLADTLPEESRKFLREASDQLVRLGKSNDKRVAAEACEYRGNLLFFYFEDKKESVECLQSAVKLDQTRDSAWDMLTFMLSETDRCEEAISVCKERLRLQESPRNRLLLASAYERGRQPAQAEEAIRAALKLDATSLPAHLALAARLMQPDKDAKALDEADEHLDKARELLKSNDDKDCCLNYYALRGIHAGLTTGTERARDFLKMVLEEDKDHRIAKPALAALDK